MAKSIRANLQLVSVKDVEDIERLDAPKVSSNPSEFMKVNLLGYYTLINTWLLCIKQWSEHGWIFLLNHLKVRGLFETIKLFDEAAGQLINGEPVDFSIARTIYFDVQSKGSLSGIPTDIERNITVNPLSAMLFLCRYPKRFSPLKADKLRDASIDGFVETQRRLKALQRQPFPRYIVERVREEAYRFLEWESLTRELLDVSIEDIVFTPGVSFDTDANLVSKLQSIQKERVEYFPQPFGIPMVASQGVEEQQYWGEQRFYEKHTVRLIAVPKNYKTARVIAPENVYRQALARCYFNVADRYLPGEVKLHDQTQNQTYALSGSFDGKLATIDLHAASDSITPTLLWAILPGEFMLIMQRILPTHYENKGHVFQLHSAATMGNSMTFWLESVVFASISKAAVREYNLFSGANDACVSVYGDDIIVPTDAAQTVIEWLEKLGFIVNHDKSFFDPQRRYRESCGEEYFDGINVSSRYFPRFPLEGQLGGKLSARLHRDGFLGTRIDTMASLLDLQHKLFRLCVPASLLVSEIIREADPRMTSSTPDQGLQDLWSYEELAKEIPAPAAEFIDGKLKKIIIPSVVDSDGRVIELTRKGHLTAVTTYPTLTNADPEEQKLVDLYNYLQFLKFGPRYDDPLSELLGISSPPRTLAESRSSGEVKWVYVK